MPVVVCVRVFVRIRVVGWVFTTDRTISVRRAPFIVSARLHCCVDPGAVLSLTHTHTSLSLERARAGRRRQSHRHRPAVRPVPIASTRSHFNLSQDRHRAANHYDTNVIYVIILVAFKRTCAYCLIGDRSSSKTRQCRVNICS